MEKFRPSIRYGLIMAVISIVVFLIQYAFMSDSFGSMTGWLIQAVVFFLALPIVFLILGARDCRPNFNPYTFGNAFVASFMVGLVSAIVVLAFNILFNTVIDPDFQEMIQEKVMTGIEERLENANMSDEDIQKMMERQEEQFAANSGIIGQVKQTGYGLVWYLILALIIGAVQKGKKEDLIAS
jgi:hypothetical protein